MWGALLFLFPAGSGALGHTGLGFCEDTAVWAQEPPPVLDLARILAPHTFVPSNEELPVSPWASVLPPHCVGDFSIKK